VQLQAQTQSLNTSFMIMCSVSVFRSLADLNDFACCMLLHGCSGNDSAITTRLERRLARGVLLSLRRSLLGAIHYRVPVRCVHARHAIVRVHGCHASHACTCTSTLMNTVRARREHLAV
jgi:hypothetical protein